jgi:flagellar biosynthesis protein FliR
MIDSLSLYTLTGKFVIGMLLFIRLTGLFVAGPFYSHTAILPQMKIFLGVIIACSLTGVYWQNQPVIDFDLWYLVFLVLKEFMVGAIIGFSANAVFYAARFGGGILDFEIGYQTGIMFGSEDMPTLLGELKEMTTLMIFILINGHHFLLESISASVKAVPLTTFQMSEPTVTLITRIATTVLIIGIKMAAPVLVALFLTNLGLVLLARVAPQTNIFILSFQMKVVVGLLMLFVTMPLFILIAKYSLQTMEAETMKLIMTLNQ